MNRVNSRSGSALLHDSTINIVVAVIIIIIIHYAKKRYRGDLLDGADELRDWFVLTSHGVDHLVADGAH